MTWLHSAAILTALACGCYTHSTSNRAPAGSPPEGMSAWPVAPPRLGERLERHYPPRALQEGTTGEAHVRILISADGQLRVLEVLSSSSWDFAAACETALTGTVWEPGRDKNGDAVDFETTFRCKFGGFVETCNFCAQIQTLE